MISLKNTTKLQTISLQKSWFTLELESYSWTEIPSKKAGSSYIVHHWPSLFCWSNFEYLLIRFCSFCFDHLTLFDYYSIWYRVFDISLVLFLFIRQFHFYFKKEETFLLLFVFELRRIISFVANWAELSEGSSASAAQLLLVKSQQISIYQVLSRSQ